jgi:predicted transcriptional regulator of viral defense system
MTQVPDHDSLFHIAEAQAGYFTAKQARAAGFTRALLAYHAGRGLFERIQRGVYRWKRFPASPNEDLFIACLRVGPQAVVSHDSALALYELSDHLPSQVHLTVPRTASRRHPHLRLHTNRLDPHEMTHYSGLLVTIVPRTIVDVATSGLADELVTQAVQHALRRGLTTPNELLAAASRANRRVETLITRILKGEEPG